MDTEYIKYVCFCRKENMLNHLKYAFYERGGIIYILFKYVNNFRFWFLHNYICAFVILTP